MDKDILKQNKLPGCDQFTRPEEIKALSKYLGHIRKVQEEHTTLEKDNLEIPGRKTGKLPEIEALSDYSDTLNTKGEITKLNGEETLYGISGKPLMNLGDNRVGLKTEELLNKLSDHSEGLDTENKPIELEDTKFNIRDILKIDNLGNSKIDLENNKEDISLDNTRLDINNSKAVEELENSKLNLKDTSSDINELEEEKLNIIDETKPESLKQEKLNLRDDNKIQTLENTKISINSGEELLNLSGDLINLANNQEELKDLESYKETLSDKSKITELSKTKLRIKNESEINDLEGTSLNIIDETKPRSLDNTRLDIKTHDKYFKQTLDDTRINLEKEDKSLELSDKSLNIKNSREELKKLPSENLKIEDSTEIGLSEYLDKLDKPRDQELETTRLDLIDLQDIRRTELPEEKLNIINESEVKKLEDTRLELIDDSLLLEKLKSDKISIVDSREELKDLSQNLKKLDSNTELETLDTTKINIQDITGKEDLENIKLNIVPDDKLSGITDLEDISGTINLEVNDDIPGISDKIVGLETEPSEISLRQRREDLVILDIDDDIISNTFIPLINENQEVDLSEAIEELDIDFSDIRLSETILGVEGEIIDPTELSDFSISLEKLEEKASELEESAINLEIGEELKSLETLRLDLEDSRESQLSDTKINLENDSKDNKLSDTILILNKPDDQELSNIRLDLEDDRENKLIDTRIDINDDRENQLINTRLDLEDTRNTELPRTIINIEDGRENELPENLLGLIDDRETILEDKRLDINDDRENNLSKTRLDLIDSRDTNLPDTRIDIEDPRKAELSDTIINLEDARNTELPDSIIELTDPRENVLEDFIDTIVDDRETKLPEDILKIIDSRENKLPEDKLELKDSRETELTDTIIELTDNRENVLEENIISRENSNNPNWFDPSIDGNELYDDVIERGESETDTWLDPDVSDNELYDDVIERGGNKYKRDNTELSNPEGDIIDELDNSYYTLDSNDVIDTGNKTNFAFASALEGDELYYKVLEFAGGKSEWEQKIQSLMSAYLSSSKISPERAEEYENKLDETRKILEVTSGVSLYKDNDTLKDTKYKLPDFNLGMLNPSAFLRWAAENTIGALPIHGSARELLLNETLALLVLAREKLEQSTKSNRDRLPGDDGGLLGDLVSGGVSGAIGKAAGRVASAITGSNKVDMSQPINRPKTKEDGTPEPVTGWTAANDRVPAKSSSQSGNSDKSLLKKVKSAVKQALSGGGTNNDSNYSFKENYLSGEGIKTTIEELCGDSVDKVKSVKDLFDLLRTSPYMTTPEKFTTTKHGGYQSQTLDSNSFWEIVLEPYTGDLNGGFSFLPGLHEINLLNIINHGVSTGYNKWIPFVSFDLQKTKLSTKSLGLYDGEIVYPVSAEYLNEFRITIADDQYKSWRSYFEKCMEVSVFNSYPHTEDFYKNEDNNITVVDREHQLVAMYKNLAFRCIVYVMTPQKSTIRRFDLLLVLKDFSEEYSGDIDSGGSDLTVTFSIVGENPAPSEAFKAEKITLSPDGKWEEKSKRTDYSSMANKAVSSVMKIL